jgi:NADH-quinone oxidoreductase subunit N
VLKLFAIVTVALVLVYAQSYARDRGLWKGELFSLTLFTLLGIMLMISANNLLVIYLGLELQALSLYTLVALRRDDARPAQAAIVFRWARWHRLPAVRHEHAVWATGTLDINELPTGSSPDVASRPRWSSARSSSWPDWRSSSAPCRSTCGCPTSIRARPRDDADRDGAEARSVRGDLPHLVEGLLPLAVDWQRMLIVLAVASLVLGNLTSPSQPERVLAYSTIADGFVLLAVSGVVGGNVMTTVSAYSAAMFCLIIYPRGRLASSCCCPGGVRSGGDC